MKKYDREVCEVCGLYEHEHHDFVPTMPPKCACPPGEWDRYVPEPCQSFEDSGLGCCKHCEHDEACHASETAVD